MDRLILTAACVAAMSIFAFSTSAQGYTVIANPGADTSHHVRVNWHADDASVNTITYTVASDSLWLNSRSLKVDGELVTVFDSIPSKTPDNQDFVEFPHFTRYVAQIDGLTPSTTYIYRIGDDKTVRRFRTAPSEGEGFTAAVISDFHLYPPINSRIVAAMGMLDTLRAVNGADFDLLLHVGDVTAWGGSYSFWRQLYEQPWFMDHTVAGVIGNHDHMTRKLENNGWVETPANRSTNQYFRFTNANPDNGYEGEEGVCYWFSYGDVLFIMLDNEGMHTDEGLEAAQAWVRQVVVENPADKIVVMEHYQWFNGVNGKTSHYDRWHQLFDELGVTLAISGNNHVYVRSYPLKGDRVVPVGSGTVYVQTPSSDNGRGQAMKEWEHNHDKVAVRWSEGPKTVGAMTMRYADGIFHLSLYDRYGRLIDTFTAE